MRVLVQRVGDSNSHSLQADHVQFDESKGAMSPELDPRRSAVQEYINELQSHKRIMDMNIMLHSVGQ